MFNQRDLYHFFDCYYFRSFGFSILIFIFYCIIFLSIGIIAVII